VKVLLTGGSGFIGSHVLDQLTATAHVPVLYDRAADPRDDITNPDRVAAAIRGCDAVIHLAAKVGLGVDITDIDDYVRTNDYGTAVVLRAAAAAGVSRLVYASSMVVYGEGAYACPVHGAVHPPPRLRSDLDAGRFDPSCHRCGSPLVAGLVPESAQLDPRNTYAATKVHGERLAAIWSRETGSTVAALRFHNVYGPRMPRNTPYAGVASLFRSSLARGEPPQVFEDGRQRRNFVHVVDVAAAVVRSLGAPLPEGLTPINIGSPAITTVGELAAALSGTVGGPTPVITGRYRLGDVRHITAECCAAEKILDWRAEIDLARGLTTLDLPAVP
jgi:dTDP-L-rhamnose 4-epimerase